MAQIGVMRCGLLGGLLMVGCCAQVAFAQQWASKMFASTSHGFGSLARNSFAEHTFELTNIYEEDVHIAAVRSSCGCMAPKISRSLLKTWETGQIVCNFDTRAYRGPKTAVITVVLDKPFPAEVQLNLSGHIRGDVLLQPGAVQLGEVDHGDTAEKRIRIEYAGGKDDWKIVDVRSENSSLEVVLYEEKHGGGKVAYQMLVRLTRRAVAGYIQSQLNLVTNDEVSRSIPVAVSGRVVPSVTVSPALLSLGVVEPGKPITKRLVVRSKTPFKIIDVRCDGECFDYEAPSGLKKLHFLPITFTAEPHSGKVVRTIMIETDLGKGASASCVATAIVKPSGNL